MSQQILSGVDRLSVAVGSPNDSDLSHIYARETGLRSMCGVPLAFVDQNKVKRKPFSKATCQTCRVEYLRRMTDLITDLAHCQKSVTDLATDFEIDAQESEERGLRWAPVILWAMAELLRAYKKT